jgi:transposase
LAARIASAKKRLDPAQINRQIGRILAHNQRAAARFAITLEPDGSPASFHLRVEHNATFDDWAAISEGAYLLRSNIGDWSDAQLWKAYIQLTQAEAAFRIHKDQLNLRPIWHQREDRVQAHILVCFLAFVLWKSLEMWQSRSGLGSAPRTILEELARISIARRYPAHRSPRQHPLALRYPPRSCSSRAPRPPRHRVAQAHASCRT